MSRMKPQVVDVLAVLLAACIFFFIATPTGRGLANSWFADVQRADDSTRYETQKTVEDTCRAMIASYESDKLTYEQYKISEDEEKQGWAEQAKMRANKTASTYNNYVLENSFVWRDNVPENVREALVFIE